MKERNIFVAPIFIVVVALLTVGAIGEQFYSLFSKIKSLSTSTENSSENELELAPQL